MGVAVGVDDVVEVVNEELIVVVGVDDVVEVVDKELIVVVEIDTDELDDDANWRRNAESKSVEDWISDTFQWM